MRVRSVCCTPYTTRTELSSAVPIRFVVEMISVVVCWLCRNVYI